MYGWDALAKTYLQKDMIENIRGEDFQITYRSKVMVSTLSIPPSINFFYH